MWNRHLQLVLVRNMLSDLAQKLAPSFLEPGGYGDLESAFNDHSRFKLAMSEGRTTKGNRKLMGKRVLTYASRQYDMTPHLKYGNKAPKLIRIHFAIDHDNGRLILGHCGQHIENATSRSKA